MYIFQKCTNFLEPESKFRKLDHDNTNSTLEYTPFKKIALGCGKGDKGETQVLQRCSMTKTLNTTIKMQKYLRNLAHASSVKSLVSLLSSDK